MQVREPEHVRPVDEDGVGVRDVEARLDDVGRHQHVVLPLHEFHHPLLQLLRVHLAVGVGDPGVGHEPQHQVAHGLDVFDAVVDEKHLPVSLQLLAHGIPDQHLVEHVQLGLHRLPVGGRGGDHGEVAGTHQGEVQRARDRGGREGEGVHVHAHLLELLLRLHPEFLLLIDHHQAQVLELHVFAHDAVRADEDVGFALGHPRQRLLGLLGGFEAVDVLHRNREVLEPVAEGFVVLHGQDGGGHQHRHLLAVAHRLESRPDGHLGFAEAHVAAHEAVHGVGELHVGLHVFGGLALVGRVFVDKRRLQLRLQEAVAAVGVARGGLAFGVEAD